MHQAPAKPPLITYSPRLTPSFGINHTVLCSLCRPPHRPWAYSAQHWCCSRPHWTGKGWMEEASPFSFMLRSPFRSLAHRGRGTPPPHQLPASDVTTPLPTWAPLGLKGASQTQATSVGLLACSPAPAVAELISHLSILRAEAEDGGGVPYRRMAGGFPPTPRDKTEAPSIPLPRPRLWLEAAIPTIPVCLWGSQQASDPDPAGAAAARVYQFSRRGVFCPQDLSQ